MGRPSDYRPEYCAQVEEFCRQGASLVEFAASIGVDRSTIQEWRKVHPAFSLACSRALAAAQAWFESKCRENLGNREFNARLAEFQMAARFREDYAPQLRVDHVVSGQVAIRSLPRQELERLAGQAIQDAEIVSESPAQLPAPDEKPG